MEIKVEGSDGLALSYSTKGGKDYRLEQLVHPRRKREIHLLLGGNIIDIHLGQDMDF